MIKSFKKSRYSLRMRDDPRKLCKEEKDDMIKRIRKNYPEFKKYWGDDNE